MLPAYPHLPLPHALILPRIDRAAYFKERDRFDQLCRCQPAFDVFVHHGDGRQAT